MFSRAAQVFTAMVSTLALLSAFGPATGYAAGGGGSPQGAAARELARQDLQRSGQAAPSGRLGANAGDTTVAAVADEYALARSLPANHVSAAAVLAARQQAEAISATGGRWREQTDVPYQAEPSGYTDPAWSNVGTGFSVVGGRITSLAADGDALFAGAADGGVWRSDDGGANWRPLTDQQPSLSVGSLAINPADHSLWVGTGEANTSQDSYLGTGVYRSAEDGRGFQQVGGTLLVDRQVYQLLFDSVGNVYAATNRGLFKMNANGSGTWSTVLLPDAAESFPPYTNHITTVAVRPGTHGREVVAVDGYRSGSTFNGFYVSIDGAQHFAKITPAGLDATDIGRTTMAYASDGRLYAIIQSPKALGAGAVTVLKGVYVSSSGDPAGPWTLIADSAKLQSSGSALTAAISPTYQVGIQAWYNQVLAVDPGNPNRIYVGLEEVFQSNDGGESFTTASPYWNLGLPCGASCPNTTHPDQHALLIRSGRVVSGNDGGVYSRPESDVGYGDWTDLNATLHNLQYYDARAGQLGGTLAFWGGLQDNGTSLLTGRSDTMVEPAGGDGFDVIVDPSNANRAVGEYTNLTTYLSTDGGHTFVTSSPSCVGQIVGYGTTRKDCDPNARFVAPFAADQRNTDHWLAGGRYVWNTTEGWNTRCDPTTTSCDWKPVYDLGGAAAATAVSEAGATQYVAWTAGGGNPGPSFGVGIATNFGGEWHQLNMGSLPNRIIAGVTVDAENPAHVFAIFNGFSRRWIPGGGLGVVFESRDGGASWTNVTGNLPDAPGDALAIVGGHLVLGTDVGVFAAEVGDPTRWSRLGVGLPNASANDVSVGPDGRTVVAATHGRGIWTLRLGG
jgi:hypothetical protein